MANGVRVIDACFGYWLAGFTDGEGCFIINRAKRRRRPTGKVYYTYTCRFRINQRDDNAQVLRDCHTHTGVGKLWSCKRHKGTNPSMAWECATKAHCLRIVQILDAYPLRGHKALDYSIWRDAVFHWRDAPNGNGSSGPRDQTQMMKYKEQLEAVRRYAG